MISNETILEFQLALKDEYDLLVTFDDASSILHDLASYYDLLARISHRMTDSN